MIKRRGFTLVELAIVLVVIGLLSGGIISAYSIINAAKVSSVISGYEDTVKSSRLFQTMYGGLPGDINRDKIKVGRDETISMNKGNGDGYIQMGCSDSPDCRHVESFNFYPQLVNSKILTSGSASGNLYTRHSGNCTTFPAQSYKTNVSREGGFMFMIPSVIYKNGTFIGSSYKDIIHGQYMLLIESQPKNSAHNVNMFTFSKTGYRTLALSSLKSFTYYPQLREIYYNFMTNECQAESIVKALNKSESYTPIEVLESLDNKVDGSSSPSTGRFIILKNGGYEHNFNTSHIATEYLDSGIGAFSM